jgi:hypothetical protein
MTLAIPRSAVAGGYPGTIQTQDASGQPAHAVSFMVAVTDFSVSPGATQLVVKRGRAGTLSLAVSGVAGPYTDSVRLSCSGLPAQSACSFSPASVVPGAQTAMVTMSITTAAPILALAHPLPVFGLWLWFPLAAFVLAGARSRSSHRRLVTAGIALLLVIILAACGGGGGGGGNNGASPLPPSGGTPAGSYTVVVTGQSGTLTHSTRIVLVVQ